MNDVNKAIKDLAIIRQHLSASREFRGFGPITIGATSIIAMITGLIQTFWPALVLNAWNYYTSWIIAAIISAILVVYEMCRRLKRHHGGYADEMLLEAAGNFIPSGVIGGIFLIAFSIFSPDLLWILPSIWLILIGLGILASMRILPPILNIGAAIYIILGFSIFMISSQSRCLSPWFMALPFAIGQASMALLLHIAWKNTPEERQSNE